MCHINKQLVKYPHQNSKICFVSGFNRVDTFNSFETKSLHSIMDVENSNSINLDNLSKSMETAEQTVTNFDEGNYNCTIL